MDGILVGLPVLDEKHHFSITCLVAELATQRDIHVRPLAHTLISWARNFIVAKGSSEFRQKYGRNPSHVLMIDDDTVVQRDNLDACEVLMAYDVDIVSASMMMKHPPFRMAYKPISFEAAAAWEPGALLECDYVGMAFTLIKWRVFEQLQPPWFMAGDAMHVSEDVVFCRYARKSGFRVWVDTAMQVGHFGATVFPQYQKNKDKLIEMAKEEPDGRHAS